MRRKIWVGARVLVPLAILLTWILTLSPGISDTDAIVETIRQSWADLEKRETALAQRVASLETSSAKTADSTQTIPAEVKKNLADLKQQLERLRGARTSGFKSIERDYRASVLLIIVQYHMTKDAIRLRKTSSGTGFFISPDGLIATNKHVLQPWKFIPRLVRRIKAGYRVKASDIRIMVWPSGAEVQYVSGNLNVYTCFDSGRNTLKLLGTPPDFMESRTRMTKAGEVVMGQFHASNNADLALLKAEVPVPVKSLRLLLDPAGIETLDPVMVMGYPTGTRILEDRRAMHSPSVGVVRKVEDTIFIDASIVGGNSGGPVVDVQGRVVGVATRIFGAASLGSCIRPNYLVPLLPNAEHFLASAREFVARHPAAARQCLDLAMLRQPSPKQTREVEAIRGSLR